jgi:hypothetical protein
MSGPVPPLFMKLTSAGTGGSSVIPNLVARSRLITENRPAPLPDASYETLGATSPNSSRQ